MARTFILGIDGGSWRILRDLALDSFNRIAKNGVTGSLCSTLPPITFPAWKCYSTGKNPGNLGVFGFINFDRERHENRQNDATDFDSAELWDYLSDEDRRSAVINMPTTYPPHEIDGIMVGGPNSGQEGFVDPPKREEEIRESGYVPLDNGHRLAFQSGGTTTIDAAEEIIASRFRTTRELMEHESFDFVNLTIYCTDSIQHYFWDKEEVEETYRILDQEFGALLDQLRADDEEWNVVVVSDHGFRPIEGAVYMDSWLEREGFLHRRDGSETSNSLRQRIGMTTENAKRVLRTLRLERLVSRLPEEVVTGIGDKLASEDSISVVDVGDWDRSDAVFLMGGIYVLNDTRREEVITELMDALESFEDPNGNTVIDEVYRTAEHYSGPYVDAAPDLIPLANNYKMLGFARSDELFDPDDDWIAGHEMEGIFLASGPDFESNDNVELDIYDVAPTLLHVMGAAVPNDLDGDVRTDILTTNRAVTHRSPLPPQHSRSVSEEEHTRIEGNLKQLGYLE